MTKQEKSCANHGLETGANMTKQEKFNPLHLGDQRVRAVRKDAGAGIKGDTLRFTTVINACAQVAKMQAPASRAPSASPR